MPRDDAAQKNRRPVLFLKRRGMNLDFWIQPSPTFLFLLLLTAAITCVRLISQSRGEIIPVLGILEGEHKAAVIMGGGLFHTLSFNCGFTDHLMFA